MQTPRYLENIIEIQRSWNGPTVIKSLNYTISISCDYTDTTAVIVENGGEGLKTIAMQSKFLAVEVQDEVVEVMIKLLILLELGIINGYNGFKGPVVSSMMWQLSDISTSLSIIHEQECNF